MKFIKVETKHTRQDINNIVSKLENVEVEILTKLYSTFKHIEYKTKEGFVGMYAAIDDESIEKLFAEYIKSSIGFSYEDLTKSILYGNVPEMEDDNEQLNLNYIAKQFVEENLITDVVLEKILESGLESLSEFDKKVLEAH